jgi:small-conductance mechanosensitive channel
LSGAFPLVDVSTWAEPWRTLLGAPLDILITLVICLVLRWSAQRLIDRLAAQSVDRQVSRLAALTGAAGRVLVDATGLANERHRQRTATTAALLKSVVTGVIFGVGLLTILDLIGIPLAPLLASAGVGGVALGFGAQSLVRDFLSGVFMIIEDQYGVGDVIDIGGVVGTVEDVSLRVTRLRDGDGVVWYVRNGEILKVGNRSQGWSVAVVDVQLGYGEDISRVTGLMSGAVEHLDEEEPWSELLLEPPTVNGIEGMASGVVTMRVTAKVRANERDSVQREMRTRIKKAFDAAGVKMPVPTYASPTTPATS